MRAALEPQQPPFPWRHYAMLTGMALGVGAVSFTAVMLYHAVVGLLGGAA